MSTPFLVADKEPVLISEVGEEEVFYYVDEGYCQISPSYPVKEDALQWYADNIGVKPFKGPCRRQSTDKGHNKRRRHDDIKLDTR